MTTASKPPAPTSRAVCRNSTGDGFQQEVDFNKTLGNDRLIIAMGNARTVDHWTKMADDFSAVAAKLKPLGLRLGYHNHTAEFTAVDGQIPEYLFFDKASPDVFVQLDVGHCVHAGGDPVAVIKKYNSRLVTHAHQGLESHHSRRHRRRGQRQVGRRPRRLRQLPEPAMVHHRGGSQHVGLDTALRRTSRTGPKYSPASLSPDRDVSRLQGVASSGRDFPEPRTRLAPMNRNALLPPLLHKLVEERAGERGLPLGGAS